MKDEEEGGERRGREQRRGGRARRGLGRAGLLFFKVTSLWETLNRGVLAMYVQLCILLYMCAHVSCYICIC